MEVGQELGAFITRYPNAAWASWGDYDARQLERDAGFAACPSLLADLTHFNARKWHIGLYDNRPKGLKQTIEPMGLVWRGTYNRGIGARNVACVVYRNRLNSRRNGIVAYLTHRPRVTYSGKLCPACRSPIQILRY